MHHYDSTVTPTFQGQGLTGTDRDGYENLMTRLGGTRSYTRREAKSKESMMQAEYTAKYSAAPFATNCNHVEEIPNSDFGQRKHAFSLYLGLCHGL